MLVMKGSSADPRRSAEEAGGQLEAGERRIGVGGEPAGEKPSGVAVILGTRALLIALLLIGSTGSARCQAVCAQLADSRATAHAGGPAKVATADHGGCHARGIASPEPLSERSGESCEKGCCTVLTHATVTPTPTPGPASAASPVRVRVDLDEVRAGSDLLRKSPPAACLESPFHFRNPPLLI